MLKEKKSCTLLTPRNIWNSLSACKIIKNYLKAVYENCNTLTDINKYKYVQYRKKMPYNPFKVTPQNNNISEHLNWWKFNFGNRHRKTFYLVEHFKLKVIAKKIPTSILIFKYLNPGSDTPVNICYLPLSYMISFKQMLRHFLYHYKLLET